MGAVLISIFLTASPSHLRLETKDGVVHVLEVGSPNATVLYVHGYYTDVDTAWAEHRLEQQFLESGVEGVFIVPEAPTGNDQGVFFRDLESLLTTVSQAIDRELPGSVVALGHSGAHRTLTSWLGSPRLTTLVLLDAFYPPPAVWTKWLDAREDHRLFVYSQVTANNAEALCTQQLPRVECQASRWSHMEIVTSGEVIPEYLRSIATSVGSPISPSLQRP